VPNRPWRLAAGTLLSLGLLWLAARGVSWAGVGVALGSARWTLVTAAVAAVLGATVLRAWCWRRLLVATTVPVTLVAVWKILLIGHFLNICVPARAGEVARVYLLSDAARIPKTSTAASLVVEKFFDLTTLLLLFGSVSWLVELPTALTSLGRGFATAAVVLSLAVVGFAWRGTALVRRLERYADGDDGRVARLARYGQTIVESLAIIRSWQGLALMQLGFLGVWLALVGANYAVLRAVGIGAPLGAAFVVMLALQLGTAVPSTPGKIGVFQYVAVLALAPFGVAREPALTFGVLMHLVGFGPLVALGGLWSWIGLVRKR
jgi:uncharacterized protein (TIRG00374 family)